MNSEKPSEGSPEALEFQVWTSEDKRTVYAAHEGFHALNATVIPKFADEFARRLSLSRSPGTPGVEALEKLGASIIRLEHDLGQTTGLIPEFERAWSALLEGREDKDVEPSASLREPSPRQGAMKNLGHYVESMLEEVYAKREEISRAFLAQHGCHPDEVEQVEQMTETGRIWYLRRKAESPRPPEASEGVPTPISHCGKVPCPDCGGTGFRGCADGMEGCLTCRTHGWIPNPPSEAKGEASNG